MASLDLIGIVLAGFSICSALVLFVAWIGFLPFPEHSRFSVTVCALLMGGFATVQTCHLLAFLGLVDPLDTLVYRVFLFVVPSMFYFFCRAAVFPERGLSPVLLLHLLPWPLIFVAPLQLALPVLFLVGAGYAVWFLALLFSLQLRRRRLALQRLFFAGAAVMALGVLMFGIAIPWLGEFWFYRIYNACIGAGFLFVIGAVVAIPDLFADVSDVARARLAPTSLSGVDVEAALRRLDEVMSRGRLFKREGLGVGALAEAVGMAPNQLSELVNVHLGMSVPRLIRHHRVEAAKRIMLAHPQQSILSVSMETGFRSQSTFYEAFREITGLSPGDWRRRHLD